MPWFKLKGWLAWIWAHRPFAGRRGPGLAGVREPRRPRPPTRPPMARAAEREADGLGAAPVATMTRRGRRWRRRDPRAGHA